MAIIAKAHSRLVAPRRIRQLARHITSLLPLQGKVLDIGCGDGRLTMALAEHRPELSLTGVDVHVRPKTFVPVMPFDGVHLPFADSTFDSVILVDVLHHADNPEVLLREARRVCKRAIIIKDHLREGPLAFATLAFMDFCGNPSTGVAMPYAYLTHEQWLELFEAVGLQIEAWKSDLELYNWPLNIFFDRRLHFLSELRRGSES